MLNVSGAVVAVEPQIGEVICYTKPTAQGMGNGLSWEHACTFRTAVGKCVSAKRTVIILGAGAHDCNNGSDGTGTTVSADNVSIMGLGFPSYLGVSSSLYNSHASATRVLTLSGNNDSVRYVTFDNSGRASTGVTLITCTGNSAIFYKCFIRQGLADAGNATGVVLDGGGVFSAFEECWFGQLKNVGMQVANYTRFGVVRCIFWYCGTGFYASSGSANYGFFFDNKYAKNTVACNMAAASANTMYSMGASYVGNTTNFTALGTYSSELFFQGFALPTAPQKTYPSGEGVTVAKDALAWTWGAYVDLLPASTLTKPFIVQQINFQEWSDNQTYKLELFYGAASPGTVSLGVYEVTTGSAVGSGTPSIPQVVTQYVPANATVGCKLMASTDGVDSVKVTLSYTEL